MGVWGVLSLHVCTHVHYSRAGRYQCDILSFSFSDIRFSFLWCPSSGPPVCLVIADDCVGPPLRPSVIYIVTYCICLCVACCRGVRVRHLRSRAGRVRRVRRAAAGGVSGSALRCRCALAPARLPTPVHACPVFCVQRPAHAAALLVHTPVSTVAISPAWLSPDLSLAWSQAASARSFGSCWLFVAHLVVLHVYAAAASGLPPLLPAPACRVVRARLVVDVAQPRAPL